MLRLSAVADWRDYAARQRAGGRTVGLVPTMGALHEGHAALFRAARDAGDVVLATSFVNPRQFHDAKDLASYPRDEAGDAALAEGLVDCLVEPTLAEMWPQYPEATATTVSVSGVGDVLEGEGRPGHFAGVASVVTKLFVITGPCRAYFGEKDYQQLVVVRRLVRDLAFDVRVEGRPIVRDAERAGGLESQRAPQRRGTPSRDVAVARAHRRRGAARAGQRAARRDERHDDGRAGVTVGYAEVVDPETLAPSGDDESGPRRALVAGFVDGVRLIDNGPVTIEGKD